MATRFRDPVPTRSPGKKSLRLGALIRCGVVCAGCGPGRCTEATAEHQIECPECSGSGCQACEQRGSFAFRGCPQKEAGPVGDVIRMIELAESGLWPVAGGSLDQSQWFADAVRQYRMDVETIKASRGNR